MREKASDAPTADDLTRLIVPEYMRSLYGAAGTNGSASSVQMSLQLLDKDRQPTGFIPAALEDYAKATATPAVIIPETNISGNPGTPVASQEPTLDVDVLAGVGQGNANWYAQRFGWALSTFSEIASWSVVPGVISVSYAVSEPGCHNVPGTKDNCSAYPDPNEYLAAANDEFIKVGLRGVSILAATGDNGAICYGTPPSPPRCYSMFPASSPYVTAVGGTMVAGSSAATSFSAPACDGGKCADGGREVGWSSDWDPSGAATGGGFSNFSSRASEAVWQEDAVSAYLQTAKGTPGILPPDGWFNRSGRAIPDVSAFAYNHVTVPRPGGAVSPEIGTSAACPTVAALIALANAERGRNGKPPLGPLNPTIYSVYASHPAAFTDVTEGSNAWPNLGPSGATGFKATAGWDAVTGLGSLRLDKLLEALNERGI
jgi:subtilase family serine protease